MRRMTTGAVFSALCILVMTSASPVEAQNFPSRPITVVANAAAGGPSDLLFRALGRVVAKDLGQPVIVENRPGGAGTLAAVSVAAAAKPDGYTLAVTSSGLWRLPLQQQTSWNGETDFTYIMGLLGFPFVTIAKADAPFTNMQDVAKFAKENPLKVSYASSGTGGSLHLGMEKFAAHADVKLTHVPYGGSSEIQAAVLGGHTMLGQDTAAVKLLADAGKVKILAAWTDKRLPDLPNVPTMTELGYPFTISSNFGLAGPKGMPDDVVKIIHNAFLKALSDPEVAGMMQKYQIINDHMETAKYRAWIGEEVKSERALLQRLGITPQK